MMISPDTFYEMTLKGKTTAEIMTVIRGLKREITRLKRIMEHPEYQCMMHPLESVQITISRFYLERAKQALKGAGGNYVPSIAEQKAIEFNNNIPYINKIEFCIGGLLDGYKTCVCIVDGDKLSINREFSYVPKQYNIESDKLEESDKEYFFNSLEELHIGEWCKNYDIKQFGSVEINGTQWELGIYFSNGHKPVKIYGDNAYPYNFDSLLELFGIEE